MTDRHDQVARALLDEIPREVVATARFEALRARVASALRTQARETESMRQDLFRALRHRHCCCDECVAAYRRWFV